MAKDKTPPTSYVNTVTPYWSTTSPKTITATASDAGSGVMNVELWWRSSSNNASWGTWTHYGTDTASPWSWNFSWSGVGYYQFYSRARDNSNNYEAAPASADALAAYDNGAPSSSVEAISPYVQTASPITISAVASDGFSGVASAELWYRYSSDNVTWGGWTLYGTDATSPYSWSFNFLSGTGYYQFYSRARDVAGNYEAAPAIADARCRYYLPDTTPPISSVNAISPYIQSAPPIYITATASDSGTGVASVELWYRYSADNATWGGWALYGTDVSSPYSWSFYFLSGMGYYGFYSRARDFAGNYEAAPSSADASCRYYLSDTTPPTSYVVAISPYQQSGLNLTIYANATDSGSGVANVELWYRYSIDNDTWGSWTYFGEAAWQCVWMFSFPDGQGYYEFYSRATDAASNYEDAPAFADAACQYV